MQTGRLALAALAALSLGGCVFDLSGDEPQQKVRASEACPPRDDANWARMQAFLEANKAQPGVKVTESGLQYRVVKEGKGTRNPTWASDVEVYYRGTFIDGTVFDERKAPEPPIQFEVGGVIKGWQEALEMMREGDRWEVVIPSGIAYGCKGKMPKVKPDQVLKFDMELVRIK